MRVLDIVFIGIVAFNPQGRSYDVMLPDGRNGYEGVPAHRAGIAVRDNSPAPTVGGTWTLQGKAVEFSGPCTLNISGIINAGGTIDRKIVDRIPYLKDADPNYTFSSAPATIMRMQIHGGLLSAHQRPSKMVVVRWRVEATDEVPIRLKCGTDWMELAPTTKKIAIFNATLGRGGADGHDHFSLYRKLSTVQTGHLTPPPLRDVPDPDGDAVIGMKRNVPYTPDYGCSPGSGGGAGTGP